MKQIYRIIAASLALVAISFSGYSNNEGEGEDEGIESISVKDVIRAEIWPVVEQCLKSRDLKIEDFNLEKQTLYTEHFSWKTLIIINRARYKITCIDDTLTIALDDREYYSNDSWNNAATPLGTKKKKKYLDDFMNDVIKIYNNNSQLQTCMKKSKLYPYGPHEYTNRDINVMCNSVVKSGGDYVATFTVTNNGNDKSVAIDGGDHSILLDDGTVIAKNIKKIKFGDISSEDVKFDTKVNLNMEQGEERNVFVLFADEAHSKASKAHTVKLRLMVNEKTLMEAKFHNIEVVDSAQGNL
ncbi:MAG: hypothetical protein ACK5IQ_02765 [Bacteroidales bacterium]